jgi:hypothetical protein
MVKVDDEDYCWALDHIQRDLVLQNMFRWVMERIFGSKPDVPLADLAQWMPCAKHVFKDASGQVYSS